MQKMILLNMMIAHLNAWSKPNSYTIGDIVKHNNEIYVANVTHKNLTNETTLQTLGFN